MKNPNSVALLAWEFLDIVKDAIDREDDKFIEDLIQWCKKEHKDMAGWKGRMDHHDRMQGCYAILGDIEKRMDKQYKDENKEAVNGKPKSRQVSTARRAGQGSPGPRHHGQARRPALH